MQITVDLLAFLWIKILIPAHKPAACHFGKLCTCTRAGETQLDILHYSRCVQINPSSTRHCGCITMSSAADFLVAHIVRLWQSIKKLVQTESQWGLDMLTHMGIINTTRVYFRDKTLSERDFKSQELATYSVTRDRFSPFQSQPRTPSP